MNNLPTKYTFTGQYSHVSDFGLMYYNARWYDSYITRFSQPDSIIPNPGNPADWDRYSYARNNPLKYRDPSGHWPDWLDYLAGAVSQFANDMTAGVSSEVISAVTGFDLEVDGNDAFQNGRQVGRAASIAVATTETVVGAATAAESLAAMGPTAGGGAACAVVTAGGCAVVAGGVLTAEAASALAGAATAAHGAISLAYIEGNPLNSGSSGRGFANSTELTSHFNKHKGEFGFKTESEYLRSAQDFVSSQGNKGVLSRVRANGDTVIYNPNTNEFAVVSRDGTIRTYFKPNPAEHGYETNLEYYNAQK